MLVFNFTEHKNDEEKSILFSFFLFFSVSYDKWFVIIVSSLFFWFFCHEFLTHFFYFIVPSLLVVVCVRAWTLICTELIWHTNILKNPFHLHLNVFNFETKFSLFHFVDNCMYCISISYLIHVINYCSSVYHRKIRMYEFA